jgi:hypothetical protein
VLDPIRNADRILRVELEAKYPCKVKAQPNLFKPPRSEIDDLRSICRSTETLLAEPSLHNPNEEIVEPRRLKHLTDTLEAFSETFNTECCLAHRLNERNEKLEPMRAAPRAEITKAQLFFERRDTEDPINCEAVIDTGEC